MKLLKVIILGVIILSNSYVTDATFSIRDGGSAPSVRYCEGNDCGLQQGTEIIKDSLGDIETDRTASQYIQDIVAYLLTFLALISVIYIMYAGFNILIGNGDEEKLKKSRQTIIYVLLGLIVIFLAWPITLFILNILNVS